MAVFDVLNYVIMNECMYICIYVCVCMCVRMYVCVCMYVCMYVRMYEGMYVCTYVARLSRKTNSAVTFTNCLKLRIGLENRSLY